MNTACVCTASTEGQPEQAISQRRTRQRRLGIVVPWLTGGTFSVILDPEDTVASLKAKITLRTGIPTENQRLKIGGKELSDVSPSSSSAAEAYQTKEARHCGATGSVSRRDEHGMCMHSQHRGAARAGHFTKGNLQATLCHKQISPKMVKGMLEYIPM